MIDTQEKEIKDLISQCELTPVNSNNQPRDITMQTSVNSNNEYAQGESKSYTGFVSNNSNLSILKLKVESNSSNIKHCRTKVNSPQPYLDHNPVCTEPTTNNVSTLDRPNKIFIKPRATNHARLLNKFPSSTTDKSQITESLPPRPISAIDSRKKSFKQLNNITKMKNLFLNEDDVDNFITYPPKQQEAQTTRKMETA